MILARVILASLAAAVLCACRSTPDLALKVEAYEAASNAHDVEAALAMFHPEAVWSVDGRDVAQGLDEVRAMLEYEAALESEGDLVELDVVGYAVTARAVGTNELLRALGFDSIENRAVFDFEGEKIRLLRKISSPEGQQQREMVYLEFLLWASEKYPEVTAELMESDGSLLNPESARTLVELARERAAEQAQP